MVQVRRMNLNRIKDTKQKINWYKQSRHEKKNGNNVKLRKTIRRKSYSYNHSSRYQMMEKALLLVVFFMISSLDER